MNFKSVKELKILVIEAGSERNNTIFFFFKWDLSFLLFSHPWYFLCPWYLLQHTSQKLSFGHKNGITKVRFHFGCHYHPYLTLSPPTASSLLPRFCLLIFISFSLLFSPKNNCELLLAGKSSQQDPFCFVISLKPGTHTLC